MIEGCTVEATGVFSKAFLEDGVRLLHYTSRLLPREPSGYYKTLETVEMSNNTVLGVACAITGNVMISLAINIQRYAHKILARDTFSNLRSNSTPGEPNNLSSEHQSPSKQTYLNSGLWWVGMVLMSLGELGNFIAYGFAPASVVSPLGVVAILSNCITAPLFFNETVYLRDVLGVGSASGGILLILLSANSPGNSAEHPGKNPKHPAEMVYQAFSTRTCGLYVVGTCICLVVFTHFLRKAHKSLVSDPLAVPRLSYLLLDLSTVALFGAYTAIASKALSTIISFDLWRALNDLRFYGLIIVAVVTAVFQVKYLNRALQVFGSTKVIPVHFTLFTLSVMAGSGLIYHEFSGKSLRDLVLFGLGCLLTFLGVYLITTSTREKGNEHLVGLLHDIETEQGISGQNDIGEINTQYESLSDVENGQQSELNSPELALAAASEPLDSPNLTFYHPSSSSLSQSASLLDLRVPLTRKSTRQQSRNRGEYHGSAVPILGSGVFVSSYNVAMSGRNTASGISKSYTQSHSAIAERNWTENDSRAQRVKSFDARLA